MLKKATVQLYRLHKQEIASEPLCDNGGHSTLLFEVRAVVAHTLVPPPLRYFDPSGNMQVAICRACRKQEELPEHLMLRYDVFPPCPQADSAILPHTLGFEVVNEGEGGRSTTRAVFIMMAHLQRWLQMMRQGWLQ